MIVHSRSTFAILLAATSLLAACDSEDLVSQLPDAGLPDATPICESTFTIHLNREGGDYTPGANHPNNNSSSIVAEPVTLPPYQASDDVWNAAVQCVKEDLAPFRIEITEDDPGPRGPGEAADHMEVVVYGGGPALIGHPESASNVSPFGCRALLGVAFVFGDEFPQESSALCLQMEFTIAKMFGIDNHVQCGDISSFDILGECASVDAVVANAELQCGEFEPRACTCGDGPTENSYEILAEQAGLCP